MPLRASQIFLRAESLESFTEALAPALQQHSRPAGRARLELAALLSSGWATVVLPRMSWELGLRLSERVAGEVLALEVDGARLFLQTRRFNQGRVGRLQTEPLGRDVELIAWELLASQQVPPALRLLRLGTLTTVEDARAGALPALLAELRPDNIEIWAVGAIPPERGEEPPVEPDVVVESGAGEARALEVRKLPSVPATPRLAEALVSIEEAQSRRIALRLAATAESERIPQPTFAYQMGAALKLEPLLQAARARRPWLRAMLLAAPLSHRGFAARCRAAIEAETGERVARVHGLRLELASGVRVPLEALYGKYLGSLAEDGAVGEVLEALRPRLAKRSGMPRAREAFLAGLLPVVAGPSLLSERASAEVAGALRAALVHDDGGRVLPVKTEDLVAVEVDADEAFERAVQNLDARTAGEPGGLTWFDLEHGRAVVSDFDDPAGASRLLSPGGRELILRILGTGSCLSAAPTRDTLLACAGADADAVRWLREEAQRRYQEGPFPALPDLFRLTEEGVDEEPAG